MMSFYEVLRCLLCDVLRRLEHISKNDVYSVTFLGRPQKYLSQVFVTFQKYPTKMVSCDFPRFIEILIVGYFYTFSHLYTFLHSHTFLNLYTF